MRQILSNLYRRLTLHLLPVFIWLGALVCVVGLFQRRLGRFEVVGLAQGQIRQIAATTTATLKSVPVQLFEEVSKWDTLAVLNDELLQAELAVAAAEIERLQAELNATHNRLASEATRQETDWIASGRRFAVDAEQLRLNILQLKATQETDRIKLEDLQLDVKIAKDLLVKDAVTPYDLQKAHAAYNALAKKIEDNQLLLTEYQQYLLEAEQRREEFARRQPTVPSIEMALEPLGKAITVQEKRIEEISARRTALTLKSPFDGVVSQIQARPGQAVLPGVPILSITQSRPTEIIAYADENRAGQIRQNMEVELVKTSPPAQIAKSQITHIGPAVELMPVRLLRNSNIPQWGRPFLIKIPPGLELTPGESVGIRGL